MSIPPLEQGRRMPPGVELGISSRFHIVLADDDPAITEMMGIVFRDEGFSNVTRFTNPRQVREGLENGLLCDLAVLDYDFRDEETGLDLAAAIKAKHPTAHIIICSADVGELKGQYNDEQLRQMGVDDLMPKPLPSIYDIVDLATQLRDLKRPPQQRT